MHTHVYMSRFLVALLPITLDLVLTLRICLSVILQIFLNPPTIPSVSSCVVVNGIAGWLGKHLPHFHLTRRSGLVCAHLSFSKTFPKLLHFHMKNSNKIRKK